MSICDKKTATNLTSAIYINDLMKWKFPVVLLLRLTAQCNFHIKLTIQYYTHLILLSCNMSIMIILLNMC